jgi:hypothetical protein
MNLQFRQQSHETIDAIYCISYTYDSMYTADEMTYYNF